MKSSEIRSAFLDFFASKGHARVASSSLIPHNDPTLFFVNAGMVQFKDVFTGQEERDYSRATTSQKCLRVSGKHNDLENVGRTPRHHTFFEMLGNFSFGDYFKDEAIPFAWEFLTEVAKIDADRLWVTVFEDDDEAEAIWRDKVGVPAARIQRLGAKENFWSMGPTGPCGPCAEIHYDHGPEIDDDERGPAFESDRYVEIWNNVFMQYEQHADGSRTELPRPSIDTGMGLERIAAVMQGVYSNYDTDLFQRIIRRAEAVSGKKYGTDDTLDTALRVIADHSRATAFLIGDGVMPGNGMREYVLRRIMRRAIRFGAKVGIDDLFLHHTVDEVIQEMGETYPELAQRADFIGEVVQGEEERFRRTLDRGMGMLDGEIDKVGDNGLITGDVVFTLEDTYGFPVDLTRLIADERNVRIDESGYNSAREAQRARGRASWKGSGEQAVGELWPRLAQERGTTRFTGHDRTEDGGKIVAIVRQSDDGVELVDALEPGDKGIIVLDQTSFYGEAGGQVGDQGLLSGFEVRDTTLQSGLHLHHGVASDLLEVGNEVQTLIDVPRRDRTRRNHTGTHLLHAALRNVLGEHVTQKGSLVAPNRLRFDFSHHKPVSGEELLRIEDEVNREILRNIGVESSLEGLEDARAMGAMALFGEKYPDPVRVVSVPDYSIELCGGTHVRRTGDIGLFRVIGESGVAAGVRRLEAQTGTGALDVIRGEHDALFRAAHQLKTQPDALIDAIARLQEEKKTVERELAELQRAMAKEAAGDLISDARDINGVKVLAAAFDGDLKEQADRLRDQLGSSVVVLASSKGGRVQLVVAATKDIAGSRIHAGKLIKEIAPLVGGGGGGRPDMAQAGGKNPDGIPKALERVYSYAAENL